jgi:hypothetical protein
MRTLTTLLLTPAVLGLAITASAAMELDEVIAKHIEARGGQDAWDAVQSMKLTGSYTAFSQVSDFTLLRKRDHRYLLDCKHNGKTVIVGYDDETLWWDNHWVQPGARPVAAEADLQALARDVDFASPLFDYAERNFKAELLGATEFEGMPAIGIKLTRPDESVETWYLDPETYLESARESPGSDFGTPMPATTYYDDFREVGGIKVPYLVESQFSTRDRQMHVEKVELNVDIDDTVFAMPAPTGMGPLVAMAGDWSVKTSIRQQPQAPWQESEREGTVETRMRGAQIEEASTGSDGTEQFWTLSYDRFKEIYRFSSISGQTNHLDILEGTFNDEGHLVLTNVETDTSRSGFGMTSHTRATILDIGKDGFTVHTEISTDGGENWFLAAKEEYTRKDG